MMLLQGCVSLRKDWELFPEKVSRREPTGAQLTEAPLAGPRLVIPFSSESWSMAGAGRGCRDTQGPWCHCVCDLTVLFAPAQCKAVSRDSRMAGSVVF